MPSLTKRRPSYADFEAAAVAVPPVDDRIVHQVPVAEIHPSPRNPRHRLTGIDELAASIADGQLLQPVVVRRRGRSGYELIAGHRRLEAVKTLGWQEIPAVVLDVTPAQAYVLTLVENLQREDLTANEEAEALGVLIREHNWSVRKVAESIRRDPLYVSRRLRVFEDPILRQPVLDQRLPVSTAEVLLRVEPQQRAQMVDEAVANGWGQVDVRRVVRERRGVTPQALGCGVTPHPNRSTYLISLLAEARVVLETGVEELSPKARRELRSFYQHLAQLASN